MAKLPSLYLKGASQRLAGAVLYQSKGRTLARELAPAVSNPRTTLQMSQRVKLANVVSVYRVNRPLMKYAFEDKKSTESDYNAFVRANLSSNLVALTKQQAAAGAAVVAPYSITSGSLLSIEHTLDGNTIVTNLGLGYLDMDDTTTVASFTDALLSNNLGLEEGMQLSLIVNLQRVNADTGIPYIVQRGYEVILDKTNQEPLDAYIPYGIIDVWDNPERSLAYIGSELGIGAACFVLSKTTGGNTRVSSQNLVMYGDNQIYTEFTSAAQVQAAIESYGESADAFLDSNTANQGSSVVIDNYIQSIMFDNVIYQATSNVPTNLEEGTNIRIYMNSPIPAGAAVGQRIKRLGDETATTLSNSSIGDSRTYILVVLPAGLEVSQRTLTALQVTINGINYSFDFYATPQE